MEWIAKLESKILLALRGLQISLVGPVILAAAFSLYFMGQQIKELVAAAQAATASQAATRVPQAVVEKKPLSAAEIQRYHEILQRLHPAVSIQVNGEGNGFTISIGDAKLYNEWMFALYSLQSYGKNVLWDASRVCLKDCGGAAVAMAVVQGYVQSVRFK